MEETSMLFDTLLNKMLMQSDKQLPRELAQLEQIVSELGEAFGKEGEIPHYTNLTISEQLSRLSSKVKAIMQGMEEKRLDEVAAKEELLELKEQIKKFAEEQKELEGLKDELLKANEEVKKLRLALEEREKDSSLKLIEDLIRFRDHLELFTENAENGHKDEMVKLLGGLYKETASILKNNGVEVIHREEEFLPEDQEVVSVKDTDDPKLHNRVSSIFSDGYRVGNRLLRPQKVVLYSYKKKEEAFATEQEEE